MSAALPARYDALQRKDRIFVLILHSAADFLYRTVISASASKLHVKGNDERINRLPEASDARYGLISVQRVSSSSSREYLH